MGGQNTNKRLMNEKEIYDFFNKIGLGSETDREKILSQGKVKFHEDRKEITCILLDNITVEEKMEV
ncbi:hypothetical protein KJ599_00900 [bacterium]|nr:hypothetical protein [bacterium]